MDQSETGIRALRQLRDTGARLVLDDFGTGYSSLSYLKHLPLDTIKIDRTFVAGLDGEIDRSIEDAVIALAHGLRIGVVAEGIETEAQSELLLEMGCNVGQGYLFAGRFLPPRRGGCSPVVDRAAACGRARLDVNSGVRPRARTGASRTRPCPTLSSNRDARRRERPPPA